MANCGKIPFPSKADATAEINRQRSQLQRFSKRAGKYRKSNQKLRSYECPICGNWHLTTSKPRKY